MEASDTAERIEQAEAAITTEPAAVNGTAPKLFKYSEFVDVGAGAAQCEHARDGQCEDTEHFHAWCRLPNPYQHQDIRAKGLAAKAMRIRLLKDPDSDPSIVMDTELSDIDDPIFKGTIVDEMVAREWAEDYLEAQKDVEEMESFEHHAQQREEYDRRSEQEADLGEAEQSAEFKALTTYMAEYIDAIHKRLEEIQKPKRQELLNRDVSSLVSLVRAKRVEEEANAAFTDTYNAWMWFVGTFHVELHELLKRPFKPMWEEIGRKDRPAAGTMFGESPEVIEALRLTFNNLQLALQRGSAGN